MERLTQISDKGGVAFTFDLDVTCKTSEIKKILRIAEKLKEYEDLEEQGLLLRLPCKVGDNVYIILASYFDIGTYNIKYAKADVRDFTHFTSCGFCVVVTSKVFGKLTIPFSDFGKTVFLTQSEAEQKLNEMESD